MAFDLSALREVFALVILGNEVPVALKLLPAVLLLLFIGVSHVLPLAGKRGSFTDLTFFGSASEEITRANNNGSIFVTVVFLALNKVGFVLIFHFVGLVGDNLGRLERELVAGLKVSVLLGGTAHHLLSGDVRAS